MSLCRSLFTLALAGCITQGEIDDAKDRDRDGYDAFQAGGDDCDDDDAAVHPGAVEVCGNEIDDDCDDLIDDDGFGAAEWFRDDDDDDYGVRPPITACAHPDGYTDRGGDCDDGNGNVHPGATEVWYDGVDQDCDEADDYDQDADGFQADGQITGGDDCDDTIDAVNPNATEVCGNHVDDDCDGTALGCRWSVAESPTSVRGSTLTLAAETPRVAVGDATGDGAADVTAWLPTSGELRLYEGPWPSGGLLPVDADVVLALSAPASGHPYAALMDVDLSGDGHTDLAVGSWSPGARGRVDVFRNLGDAPTLAAGDAFLSYQGPADGTGATVGFGSVLASHGRLGTDTRGTLSSCYDIGADTCFVFRNGASSGVADAIATRITGTSGLVRGHVVGGAHTGRLLARVDFSYYLVDPTLASPISAPAQPQAALFATATNAEIPTVVPDLDGDGTTEVLALLRQASPPRIAFRYGPTTTTVNTGRLEFIPDGTTVFDAETAAVGDFDGDGAADVAVLADTTAGNPVGARTIGVLFGPFTSREIEIDTSRFTAMITLDATTRAETLVAADVDGDGYDDLVAAGSGFVMVLHGEGL